MAVFRFTVTGTIEADADALGAAMAASLPAPSTDADALGILESSLEFSENPGSALQALLEMGVMAALQAKLGPLNKGWDVQALEAIAVRLLGKAISWSDGAVRVDSQAGFGTCHNCLGLRRGKTAGQDGHDRLELLAKDVRVDGSGGKNCSFHVRRSGHSFHPALGQGHHVASAVGRAALAPDVAVDLEPAECFSHGLGLDADQLGQLGLRHGSVKGKYLHGDHSGMGEPDGSQLLVPGVFHETCRGGQEAPCGPAIHIRHTT
jgi:hypothetical protein